MLLYIFVALSVFFAPLKCTPFALHGTREDILNQTVAKLDELKVKVDGELKNISNSLQILEKKLNLANIPLEGALNISSLVNDLEIKIDELKNTAENKNISTNTCLTILDDIDVVPTQVYKSLGIDTFSVTRNISTTLNDEKYKISSANNLVDELYVNLDNCSSSDVSCLLDVALAASNVDKQVDQIILQADIVVGNLTKGINATTTLANQRANVTVTLSRSYVQNLGNIVVTCLSSLISVGNSTIEAETSDTPKIITTECPWWNNPQCLKTTTQ